ncbi:MAG: serine/threonine protein kinase [Anaerolineales bacterium]|nr:serine/threonine protein kinase [Anaerolineales bacterium]
MPLQPGQTLNNRYRIVKLLGQGGFGAVYRAWDVNLNRPCAVKENLEISPEAQRQFAREATVLANLSHPNLPRVTDHFTIQGQGQYLVMDFVEGDDLASIAAQMVERQGRVPLDQALGWISQVADALTYLHTRQTPVVHRDIKPANIRLTPEGRAMLVDFGLVKMYNPEMRTTLGARAVTPGYAPPEQYGRGSTDTRSDIYALGATLYKLLSGQEPVESVQRMIGAQMPTVAQLNPSVPAPVSRAIEQAMQVEPGQRYQTAEEFKRALSTSQYPGYEATMMVKPVAAGAQVRPVAQAPAARRPMPVTPSSRPRSGSRLALWVGLAAVLLLCLGGLLLLGLWMIGDQQASATATENARLKSTLDERVRATSTAQALFTAAAQASAATATAGVNATATAQFFAVEQARNDYVSSLQAERQLAYGPASGSLLHEAEDGLIEGDAAEVDLKNFFVEARFYNPYATSLGSWDYGFILRHADKNTQYRFIIQSDQTWVLMNNSGDSEGVVIGEGELPSLDVNENGSNLVLLIFKGSRGLFYLNNEFIVEFDLSTRLNSGDIFVVTGIYTGDEVTGEATDYRDFTIWSLP